MNYKYYERKISDVITKCPIEVGVEILTFNLIDSIVDNDKFSLIDVSTIKTNMDNRLETFGGIPDMAIVSTDFEYKKPGVGKVYGFIEVKPISNPLYERSQVENQRESAKHHLYTNGLVWQYFCEGHLAWEVILEENGCKSIISNIRPIKVDSDKFNLLVENLSKINWDN